MTEAPRPDAKDYRDTVFLPKTDFPMKAGLPQKEPGILAKWQEQDLYRALRDARKGEPKFILHDGPPYANGDMHIGHALNHILKDMVVRTQSLLGRDAPYVPGWDCHGLPIEWKVEEEYRKKKRNKDEVPVEEFRAECRAYAQNWVNRQREQLKRLGINGDWDNPYLTMHFDAEATIVGELLKFAESGQLYRGAKPVMWSPVEKTALAEAEVEYEDITSTQIDMAFEIVDSPIKELIGAHAVIWTTTPWTIPVNQALAYGPEIEYVVLTLSSIVQTAYATPDGPPPEYPYDLYQKLAGTRYLVAQELYDDFYQRYSKAIGFGPVFQQGFRCKGADLAGTIARHPMANHLRRPVLDTGLGLSSDNGAEDSQAPHQVRGDDFERMVEFFERPRPFLPGDFVTTDSGTGLVHMAPDHGEDDFDLCKAHGIEPVFAVLGDGKYRDDWAWLGGQGSVINPKFNAPDGPICSALREAGGLLAASADYKHSYPHSWRSKAKVIYRCTPQWFVPMDKPLSPSPLEGEGRGEGDTQTLSAADAAGPSPHSSPSRGEEADTLRKRAMAAIAATRWVPEKGQNRITAMVEGRPDWVLSRQRAWGVPITLFVDRKTGQYLNDPAVNARIVAGVKELGVDAWSDDRAQGYLGDPYKLEDYERVTDILDVWFDSGSTHAFVLESGKWPDLMRPEGYTGPLADLYLEGSDQHRGWFQSSLLESCGTRGHAPYKAVLTHGFTMDQKGMKMSKSLGNTIDPLKVMETYGADIIRLWALSVDFTEDHRIGDEILKGVSDQYRKLRNTFRYLLGALEGFSEAERVTDVSSMPELERYVLNQLFHLDVTLQTAIKDFDFNEYVRSLTDFCNEDLSAFFFDIRKDCLYCDAPTDPKRMAYRTVLDILFHRLVRYAAPVLVFTSEEVWQSRFPGSESIHLLELDEAPNTWQDGDLAFTWDKLRILRSDVLEAIEPMRREKIVGSSLAATVTVPADAPEGDLAELFITGTVTRGQGSEVTVAPTTDHKCGRCWRHLPEVKADGDLCGRCDGVVNG
jgi:isoleucyl-tRNA synthetase